jgi:twinkle protein
VLTNRMIKIAACRCSGQHSSLPRSSSSSTFVSRHVTLPMHDITGYLSQRGVEHRVSGGQVVIKECPFCHATKGKVDNMWKLYVGGRGGGAYMCHRCGSSGSWYDYKRRVLLASGEVPAEVGSAAATIGRKRVVRPLQNSGRILLPDQRAARSFAPQLMENPANSHIKRYLVETRGIHPDVLYKYGVGCAVYQFAGEKGYESASCITFPWVLMKSDCLVESEWKAMQGEESANAAIVRIKARALENKGWQRLDPAGGRWGLFGLHTVPLDAKEVVLTEGEFDAMAVFQATGMPSVSLPNGCRSLPVEVLPLLERFERIYLWMDNDGPGQDGAAKFAKKLGERRCALVRPSSDEVSPPKDANAYLLEGKDIRAMLDSARPAPHDYLVDFASVREQVLREALNPANYTGTPLGSFPNLTKIIKGFRKGELSVLTGATGRSWLPTSRSQQTHIF